MTARERIRAAISDSYYDARNDGLTMEHAADVATAKVTQIHSEEVERLRALSVEAPVALYGKEGREPICDFDCDYCRQGDDDGYEGAT